MHLVNYTNERGHSSVPRNFETDDGFALGNWVAARRKEHSQGILSEERIGILNSTSGWTWELLKDKFSTAFEHLQRYVYENGDALVPDSYETVEGFKLGSWVTQRRVLYKRGKISPDRIDTLESLPGWVWDTKELAFQIGFDNLEEYVDEHGHARVPARFITTNGFKLGGWVSHRRKEYKNGKLSTERLSRLETLDGWVWDLDSERFAEGLMHLKRYISEYGHPRVPARYTNDAGFNLGTWCSTRRASYRRGTLSVDHSSQLELLPGWMWKM